MAKGESQALRQKTHAEHAVHYSELGKSERDNEAGEDAEEEDNASPAPSDSGQYAVFKGQIVTNTTRDS